VRGWNAGASSEPIAASLSGSRTTAESRAEIVAWTRIWRREYFVAFKVDKDADNRGSLDKIRHAGSKFLRCFIAEPVSASALRRLLATEYTGSDERVARVVKLIDNHKGRMRWV
jgi:hypothetical protein